MTFFNEANPTEKDITEELSTEFEDYFSAEEHEATSEQFLKDCSLIAHHLSDPNNLLQGLKKLDLELQQTVDQKLEQLIAHYKAIAAIDSKAELEEKKLEQELKHVVSAHLTRKELEHDFTLYNAKDYGGGKVQTYTRFLDANAFRKQVADGCHWKDPTVGGRHGEYTHRLQWYLIATELREQITEPVKVFKNIGRVVWTENTKAGLWDALFDRNGGEAPDFIKFKVPNQSFDGRSPERFTSFVIDDKNADQFPVLHWFVKARLKKRILQDVTQTHFVYAYTKKKIAKYEISDTSRSITGIFKKGWKGGTGVLKPGTVFEK